MVELTSLWLPVLVSAVAVFIASSIVWMVLPHHKTDWRTLKDDRTIQEFIRGQGLTGGMHMFPACRPDDLKSPEAQERFKTGPWGTLIVLGGPPSMGRSLGQWFVYLVVVGILVAYVAGRSFGAGASFQSLFRLTSVVAWLAYSGAAPCGSIWEGKPWSFTWKNVLDGLAYGLATGAIFGWLWPDAAAT